jgi:hypothetical protein
MTALRSRRAAAALVFAFAPLAALAAGVSVKFDLDDPAGSPFPSDRFTVADASQNTLRRVQLPKPDCGARPSDCADLNVLNALDGFSTQPRITVPFDGEIDLSSVSSDTVYLVNLGDTLSGRGFGHRVGIDQVQWDPATHTLVFEAGALLEEHSRYLLVVTDGVRDASGKKLKSDGLGRIFGVGTDRDSAEYRRGGGGWGRAPPHPAGVLKKKKPPQPRG